MRARLNEPHLQGQQRQAVASRAGQQDAGNVQRVEDLLRLVPQARRLEKLDVQPRPMPDRLPSSKEVGQAAERRLRGGRAAQLLLLDPGQAEHGIGHRSTRVDQLLQRGCDLVGGEGDRPDLDHTVSGRVETRRFEVQGSVFRQLSRDSTNRAQSRLERESWNVICAPDGNRGDRGSQAS